jgi:hypothetical protein
VIGAASLQPCCDPALDGTAFGLELLNEATSAIGQIKRALSRLERIGLTGISIETCYEDRVREDGTIAESTNTAKVTVDLREWRGISVTGPAVFEDDGREYDFSEVLGDGKSRKRA